MPSGFVRFGDASVCTAIFILSEWGGAYTERRIHSQDQKSAGRSPGSLRTANEFAAPSGAVRRRVIFTK